MVEEEEDVGRWRKVVDDGVSFSHSVFPPLFPSFPPTPAPQNNEFSGSLPSTSDWSMVHVVHLQNNRFSGTIPASIDGARLVTDLNLANNA